MSDLIKKVYIDQHQCEEFGLAVIEDDDTMEDMI